MIDNRWERLLHRDLHAAGTNIILCHIIVSFILKQFFLIHFVVIVTAYFLNPVCQYSRHFSDHPEVRKGLKEVIKRLEPDLDIQAQAINEVSI